MSCTSEALRITNNEVTTVDITTCVSIPENVISFSKGSKSAWVFKAVAKTIERIEFTNAKNLKTIGDYTFYNCSKITTLDLTPCTSLSYVGVGAFSKCSAREIKFPDSPLKNLPTACFCECINLEYFDVPSNIEVLEGETRDGPGVFGTCTSLTRVNFKEDSNCYNFGGKSFVDSSLETLFIPMKVNMTTGYSFRSCLKLREITVDPKNPYFKAIGGVLYSKKDELVYYPQLATERETAKIAAGTKTILSNSFTGISSYKFVEIPESVKQIQESAFYGFNSLERVTIPSSVDSIGRRAFCNCPRLLNVTFNNAMTILPEEMFASCGKLETFRIPEGVETLERSVFEKCPLLREVYIPVSVKTFGAGVFRGCSSNINLIFAEGSDVNYVDGFLYNQDNTTIITYLGNKADVTIKSTVTTIGKGAFQGRDIESVTYDDISKVTKIESYAFSYLPNLRSITIPDISIINEYTFAGCTSLEQIIIPQSVKSIEKGAFFQCNKLTTVQMSEGLISIGQGVFDSCTVLSNCILPSTVQKVCENAFANCIALTSFNFPSDLTFIGEKAFANAGILHFTVQTTNIVNLTRFAFDSCNLIEEFRIPDSVETMNENSIRNCNILKVIYFGCKLTQIDDYAISDCPLLEKIIIGDNEVLSNFTSLAFNNCDKLVTFDTTGVCNVIFEAGILYNKGQTNILIFLKANKPKVVEIPESVEEIYNYAFSNCPSIESVKILGNGIKRIGLGAFQSCTALESINFPGSLDFIGTNAFKNCNLIVVDLVKTQITSLNEGAYSNNLKLAMVYLPTHLSSCATTAFSNTYSKVMVFYHGKNFIENTAGFAKNAQMICSDDYQKETFLSLPVQYSVKIKCATHKNSFRFSFSNMLLCLLYLY